MLMDYKNKEVENGEEKIIMAFPIEVMQCVRFSTSFIGKLTFNHLSNSD